MLVTQPCVNDSFPINITQRIFLWWEKVRIHIMTILLSWRSPRNPGHIQGNFTILPKQNKRGLCHADILY